MMKVLLLSVLICCGLTACARTNGIALDGREGAEAQLQVGPELVGQRRRRRVV